MNNLTPTELDAYESFRVLEDELWRTWPDDEQKSFLKKVEQQKIPRPLPKPEPLGKDSSGRDIDTYTVEEYEAYERTQSSLARLRKESAWFRESKKFFWKSYSEDEKRGEIEDERNRRKLIGRLQRKTMGKYEGNPEWDDVVPIPQDDGEGALAQIAYTEEYAEGECLSSNKVIIITDLFVSASNGIFPCDSGSKRALTPCPRHHRTHYQP